MKKSSIKGIDNLLGRLKEIETGAGNLDGTTLPIPELFSPTFMQANTPFPNIHDWLHEAGISINSWEDMDANMDRLNAFTVETTAFSSWDDMKAKAVADYVFANMGF